MNNLSSLHDEARAFWQRQLQAHQNSLSLKDACLFESNLDDSASGVSVIELSGRSREVVRKISKQTDLGTFVVVSAAVSLLARRYTGGQSVTLEVPRAGVFPVSRRPAAGCLPLVVSFDKLRTFKDLIVEVQQTTSDSYRYQDFPLQQFASEGGSQVESDVFVALSSPSGSAFPRPHHNLSVRVDAGDAIRLRLSSPSGKFPAWFLDGLGEQLEELLALFGSLNLPLATFEDAVRNRSLAIIEQFNRTERPFPREATVLDLFQNQVRSQPAATALICGSASLSYEELDREATRLATYLRGQLGIAERQVVAALNTRSHWAVVSLLGILKAGAVYLPLNPQSPAQKIHRMLVESGAEALVAHSRHLGVGGRFGQVPTFTIDVQLGECEPPSGDLGAALAAPGADDLAYIIYTSGTTGVPKGVMIAHGGLANTALDHIDRFQVRPADRYLQFMALSFDGFLLDTFTTLCAGAALVIADEDTILDPSRFMDYLQKHGATISTITPSYLQLLEPSRLSTLRLLVSAGEVIDAKLAKSLAERLELYNGYGPTEATINSTLHRIDPANCHSPIPIGGPSANKQIYVVNEQMEEQPVGVIGEICIAGAGLALGYLNDQELTEAKFIENPFNGGGRLYRTGDFGAWSADGSLLFKGRADNQVKVNGHRIDLSEIQAALDAHPSVRTSQVLACNPDGHRTQISAFYQRVPSEPVSEGTLRSHLAAVLPDYMIPHRFIEVYEWPLTAHGKTDAAALMRLAELKRPGEHNHTPPASLLEQRLCEVWSEVLGQPSVGVEESFFSLGGDSILIIQAVCLAQTRGIRIEARDILEQRTVRQLARHLERSALPGSGPQREPTSGRPPLYLAELSAAEREALPPGIEDAYPAALMQTFMIDTYLEDRGPGGIYIGCAEWRFEDPSLSEEALIKALQHLYDRNRSLRAAFMRSPAGRTLLLIKRTSPLEVPRSVLRGLGLAERDAFFRNEIERETARRFEPYSLEPLVRFRLYRTGDDNCSLFVSFHHALLDGWSGIELRNALFESYTAAKAGAALPPPTEEADSYKEFVALEQAVIRETSARRFWQAELTSEPGRARLNSLRRKTAAARTSPPHATLEAEFPSGIAAAAVQYSERHGTSLKALFLSSVAQTVMGAAGVSELALAVVTNGRSDQLTEPFRSTGLFWNIVPFTTSLAEALSVRRVQEKLNEIAPYGHFPWKEIEDDIARQKLFLPVFNFVNFHNADAGARRFTEGVVQSRFHFPLTFFVKFVRKASGPSAALRVDVDRSFFGEAAAASMWGLVHESISATVKG